MTFEARRIIRLAIVGAITGVLFSIAQDVITQGAKTVTKT